MKDETTKTEAAALDDENRREIAVRVGSEFTKIADKFLPFVGEALGRSEKEISFGVTVKMKRREKDQMVICRLVAHEPKIPTEPLEDVHFVIERAKEGNQLAFVWPGTLKDFHDELKLRDVRPDPMPGDDYDPAHPDGDNKPDDD